MCTLWGAYELSNSVRGFRLFTGCGLKILCRTPGVLRFIRGFRGKGFGVYDLGSGLGFGVYDLG